MLRVSQIPGNGISVSGQLSCEPRQGEAMPHAVTPDGVRLYYEEAGSGTAILFVHEYSGDWRS